MIQITARNVFMLAQVKIFVGASQSYAANDPNVRVYKDEKTATFFSTAPKARDMKASLRLQLRALLMFQSAYCDDLLGNKEVMEETGHADLVVGENLYLCSSLVADKLSLPHVILSASTLSTPTAAIALGLPSPPSYVPQCGVSLTQELTFVDRVKNVFQWLSMNAFYVFDLCPTFSELKKKHNITPNKSVQETLGRVDMIISQMDFTLEQARPLLPSKYLCCKINCGLITTN